MSAKSTIKICIGLGFGYGLYSLANNRPVQKMANVAYAGARMAYIYKFST
jgi:hypothetical protein